MKAPVADLFQSEHLISSFVTALIPTVTAAIVLHMVYVDEEWMRNVGTLTEGESMIFSKSTYSNECHRDCP